jgi:prepilin-type N-terminal cleavage/methylation domain-containing protein
MGNDRGFSLLETLIAISILAAVVVAFTSGMTTGWRGIAVAEKNMQALAVARNELERAGVEWPLSSGSRQGVSPDGLAFSVVATPAAPATIIDASSGAPALAYWVTVEVQGNGVRRPVRLQTMKTEGLR